MATGMTQVTYFNFDATSFSFCCLDTLLHGNYGLSYDQSKAQLAIWAILAAPFLLSTDLRTIKPEIKELLLNRDIIAVDQDALGIQGRLINKGYDIEIWARPVLPIVNGQQSYAIAFTSRRTDGHPYGFKVTLNDLNLKNEFGYIVKVGKIIQIFCSCLKQLVSHRISSTHTKRAITSYKPIHLKSELIQQAPISINLFRLSN